MRAAAQLISYEVSQGLALIGVLMMAGTLSLTEIANAQADLWYIVPQFVGFLVFLTAGSPRPTAPRSTSPRPTPSWCRAT
jgi:NADH-quinone oxidoreductase subunit H